MLAKLALSLLPFALGSPIAGTNVAKREFALNIFAQRDGKCLVPVADNRGLVGVGTPVVSGQCGGIYSWDITYGSGPVVLSGQNLCLDAGSNPGNNGALKLWTCYPGLYQQTWYYTDDRRIAITGGDQCLDEGTNGIQTYRCTTGNTNQIFIATSNRGFTYLPSGPTQSPSPTASPSSTVTTTSSPSPSPSSNNGVNPALVGVPTGAIQPYPPYGGGRQIRPYGRPDLCLTVQNGYAGVGSAVAISYCFALDDPFIGLQLWDYPGAYVTGQIKLHNNPNNLCLDFGSNPSDGGIVKVWTCYPGLVQQTFYYTSDDIALGQPSPNQCLDIRLNSQGGTEKPYNSVAQVQSWTCGTQLNQQFPKFFANVPQSE